MPSAFIQPKQGPQELKITGAEGCRTKMGDDNKGVASYLGNLAAAN